MLFTNNYTYASIYFTKDQYKVLDDINQLRLNMGLSPVELDEALTRAAIDHSIYLFTNNKIGHEQEHQLYRTQQHFYERIEQYTVVEYYNYKPWRMIAEDVDYRSPVYAVSDLVEAPYHRYPIIYPQLTHIGVGSIGYHNTVVTFGMTENLNYLQSPILYPYHNEKDVLLSQKVYEIPDPFEDTPMDQEEAGYVLSIYTGVTVHSNSLSISIYDEYKEPVDFILKSLTPNEGSDFWIVIPTKPFKPSTSYTFKVNNSTSTFTTMTQEKFDEWNILREKEYVPYSSKKAQFDNIIASLKNPELYAYDNEVTLDVIEILPKPKLPTVFEQRGYNSKNVGIYLHDDYIELNPSAKIKDERTFIPLRGVLEHLDAKIDFNTETKEIVINHKNKWIMLKPYSETVLISNGESITPVTIDVTAFIENGKTFVPLRFLTETLEAQIVWDQSSFTVGISY